ncbi:MAG TPA: hypothetical protein VFA45_22385, partial [Actinomycetes bacterium]|nr:hypothetical protein [Actinomycetes bacterium]
MGPLAGGHTFSLVAGDCTTAATVVLCPPIPVTSGCTTTPISTHTTAPGITGRPTIPVPACTAVHTTAGCIPVPVLTAGRIVALIAVVGGLTRRPPAIRSR